MSENIAREVSYSHVCCIAHNATEKANEDETVIAGFSNPQESGVLEGKDSDSGRIKGVGWQLNFKGLNKGEAVNINYTVPSTLATNRREIRRQTLDRNVSMRGGEAGVS